MKNHLTEVRPPPPSAFHLAALPLLSKLVCRPALTISSLIANLVNAHANLASIGFKRPPKGVNSPFPSPFHSAAFTLFQNWSAAHPNPPPALTISLPIANLVNSHARPKRVHSPSPGAVHSAACSLPSKSVCCQHSLFRHQFLCGPQAGKHSLKNRRSEYIRHLRARLIRLQANCFRNRSVARPCPPPTFIIPFPIPWTDRTGKIGRMH